MQNGKINVDINGLFIKAVFSNWDIPKFLCCFKHTGTLTLANHAEAMAVMPEYAVWSFELKKLSYELRNFGA